MYICVNFCIKRISEDTYFICRRVPVELGVPVIVCRDLGTSVTRYRPNDLDVARFIRRTPVTREPSCFGQGEGVRPRTTVIEHALTALQRFSVARKMNSLPFSLSRSAAAAFASLFTPDARYLYLRDDASAPPPNSRSASLLAHCCPIALKPI